jgi:hypothetical protein
MRQATVNAGVIAALVMSLLAASGMPAGAASTSLQSADYVVETQRAEMTATTARAADYQQLEV